MTNEQMENALIAVGKIGRQMGIEQEHDRIVTLLETKHNCTDDDYICICLVGDLIRLVKGEGK
jgi:hypothetical protein